jgi:vacuolar-type H+-ATPase subunit H
MVGTPTTDTNLSPLDQIRQVEAEVTRQIAAAREAADHTISEAGSQVSGLLDEARVSGRHRGQTRYKEIISGAEEEARALVSQAHNQADDLRRKGKRRMTTAVRHAASLVIGLEGSSEDK